MLQFHYRITNQQLLQKNGMCIQYPLPRQMDGFLTSTRLIILGFSWVAKSSAVLYLRLEFGVVSLFSMGMDVARWHSWASLR